MSSQFERLKQQFKALSFRKQKHPNPSQNLDNGANFDGNKKHAGSVADCIACLMYAGTQNETVVKHQKSQSKAWSSSSSSNEALKSSPLLHPASNWLPACPTDKVLESSPPLHLPSNDVLWSSPILRLPGELRLKIYEHLFAGAMLKAAYSDYSRRIDPNRPAFFFFTRDYHWRLLLTCRAVYQEARPVLAGSISIVLLDIDSAAGWNSFVGRLGSSASSIQHLTLCTASPYPYRQPYHFNMAKLRDLQTFTINLRDPRFTDLGRADVSDLETTMDWLRGKHDDILVKRYEAGEPYGRYCRWCRFSTPTPPFCQHQLEQILLPGRTFRLRKHLAFSVQLYLNEGGRAVLTPDGREFRAIQRRGWLIYDVDSKQIVDTLWVQCKKTKGWPKRVRRECITLNRQCEAFWNDSATNFTYSLRNYGIFPYEPSFPRDERWTTGMRRPPIGVH